MEIIIGLAFALFICILIVIFADEPFDAIGCVCSIILLFFMKFTIIIFIQSGKKAEYLNKTYNKQYTTEDIFWNEELIKSQLKIEDKIIDNSSKIKVEMNNK